MIAQLTGIVSRTANSEIIVDVVGIGYGVYVPQEDRMQLEEGVKTTLHVYEHIQERAHDLYGFREAKAKELFVQLLSVNGVGPKAALAILDLGRLANIKQAIVDGNVAYISGASGVGKRTAERVAVDLKDKLLDDVLTQQAAGEETDYGTHTDNEALEALVALGYTQQQAMAALSGVEAETTEDRVKQALKEMT